MTTKADFTTEEWQNLLKAPLAVGAIITMASFSLGDAIFESLSVGKKLGELVKEASDDTLMAALAAEYKGGRNADVKQAMESLRKDSRDPAVVKAELLGDVQSAATAVDAKASSQEATQFKQWLYSVGEAAANAAKEGDFLGIGGQKVSPEEKNALDEIKLALGL